MNPWHPSDAQLELLVLNRIPDSTELERIESHLLHCASCIDRSEQVEEDVRVIRAALWALLDAPETGPDDNEPMQVPPLHAGAGDTPVPPQQGALPADTLRQAHTSPSSVRRLLFLDDDEGVGRLVEHALTLKGVQVTWLTGLNEQSLAYIPGGVHSYSVALIDVFLGRQSGIAAAQLLLREHPQIRIVFLSGYPEDHAPAEIKTIPGFTYLTKPVRMEVLLRLLEGSAELPGA